jgi:LAO/AO transport system kinase
MTVLERFFRGDQAALARIISFIEDCEDGYRELLSRLYPKSGKALKIGFTGPPGSGKSSLVNNISKKLAREGHRIAVVAVDPTSPFTGGALLGDRVRMSGMPTDGSIYIRSMATRGSTGGLAAATGNVVTALDAYGFDFILIETVGVGQVELDIVDTCDTVVVVLVPESGDAIQALKAGLMEIADVFAVNKADRPGANHIIMELNSTLDLKRQKTAWELPVVATEAINDKNTDQLINKIKEHIGHCKETGTFADHRRHQIKRKIDSIIQFHINNLIWEKVVTKVDVDKLVTEIFEGKNDPFTVSQKLLDMLVADGLFRQSP